MNRNLYPDANKFMKELDLSKICKSFGFEKPPFTTLNIRPPTSSMKRRKEKMTNKEKFYNNKNESDEVPF